MELFFGTISFVLTVLKLVEGTSPVAEAFAKEAIIPDIIDQAPEYLIEVTYGNLTVNLGNVLTPTQVKDIPSIKCAADPNKFYVLIKTDPDPPSRKEPKYREWHHFLVGNMAGCDLSSGEILSEYVGAGPPQGAGLHRYVFLIYEQPGKLSFDEKRLNKHSGDNRPMFSTRNFTAKYNLGQPIAGNFYQAEWDPHVPHLFD